MKWQTIDTAPKDGTAVLVYGEMVEIGTYLFADGRSTWCDSGQEPTHWMPLPEPPTASDSEAA